MTQVEKNVEEKRRWNTVICAFPNVGDYHIPANTHTPLVLTKGNHYGSVRQWFNRETSLFQQEGHHLMQIDKSHSADERTRTFTGLPNSPSSCRVCQFRHIRNSLVKYSMITVPFVGQLGNQFFCYVIGKILAERTGQAYHPNQEWLTKSGEHIKWIGPRLFPPPLPTAGRNVTVGHVQRNPTMYWIDFKRFDKNHPILARGFFQRYELLYPYKQRIQKEWLKLLVPYIETDPQAVYIHVRRTDYIGDTNPCCQCAASSLEEFDTCLKHFSNINRIVLVSDDYHDPMLDSFDKLGLPVTRAMGNWEQDFLTMASARNLIISQSTFSWWAGWLGRAKRIVCPMKIGSFWARGQGMFGPSNQFYDYPNLYPYDEPDRWQWVTV